jgi:hypothetical protein
MWSICSRESPSWPAADITKTDHNLPAPESLSLQGWFLFRARQCATSRCVNAKLGAEWTASPFSQDFFILCFMPVYPGALKSRFFADTNEIESCRKRPFPNWTSVRIQRSLESE